MQRRRGWLVTSSARFVETMNIFATTLSAAVFSILQFQDIVGVSSAATAGREGSCRVKAAIYYESLCPDSVRFFARQLAPNYQDLKPYLDLEFIPFGKAFVHNRSGRTTFTCQHGERECFGNKVMACALDYLKDDADLQARMMNCIMSNRDPPTAGLKCASEVGIPYTTIEMCSRRQQGDQLLVAMGEKTLGLFGSQLAFVPTITLNGTYSDSFRTDFRGEVCQRCGC